VTFTIKRDEKAFRGTPLDARGNFAWNRQLDSRPRPECIYLHPKVNRRSTVKGHRTVLRELERGNLSPHFAGHAQKTLHQQVRARRLQGPDRPIELHQNSR
jgi:hypothetical protein